MFLYIFFKFLFFIQKNETSVPGTNVSKMAIFETLVPGTDVSFLKISKQNSSAIQLPRSSHLFNYFKSYVSDVDGCG